MPQLACLLSLGPRFLQAVDRKRSQTHFSGPSTQHVAIKPGSTPRRDLQIETAAVGIQARLICDPCDFERCQTPHYSSHALGSIALDPGSVPPNLPTNSLSIMAEHGERVQPDKL